MTLEPISLLLPRHRKSGAGARATDSKLDDLRRAVLLSLQSPTIPGPREQPQFPGVSVYSSSVNLPHKPLGTVAL